MSQKGIKVRVDLDFVNGRIDKEEINKQINSAIDAVKINLDPQSAKEFEGEFKRLGGLLQKHLNEATGKIDAKKLTAALDNDENFAMIEKLGDRYAAVGVNGQESFRKIAEESDYLNQKLMSSNTTLEKMGDTLKNTIRWNISSSVVNAASGAIQEMYYFAKDLDRTMSDIRVVTGKSAEEMDRFAQSANTAAKELNVSTIDYGKAATTFFQQGFDTKQVENMTEAAIVASNITGIATEEMSNLLTSTLNGFRMNTDEIMSVVDKFAAVGAETASDFYEIATGMSKVSSMAESAGVPIDNLTGQLATITSVTRQAPESVGTALKTIYGRMLAFKTNTDKMMKDDNGEVFGVPQVEKALEAFSQYTDKQISLFKKSKDGARELRDVNDVFNEIGESWDQVGDSIAKFGLTTALAGNRQQNNLIALFENWDMYKDAVETSLNAEGTALEQNEIKMNSYQGKLMALQAAKEELYMSVMDSDSMKSVIDGLTKIVELTAKIFDTAGGFSALLGLVGAAYSKEIMTRLVDTQGLLADLRSSLQQITPEQQVGMLKELQDISKVYGDDKANQLKEELRGQLQVEKEMKVQNDLLFEKIKLMEEFNAIEKRDSNAATKGALIDTHINESKSATRGEIPGLKEMEDSYKELINLKEEFYALDAQSSTGEVAAETQDAMVQMLDRIYELEEGIESVKFETEDYIDTISDTKDMATRAISETKKEIAEIGAEADKVIRYKTGLQTFMLGFPAAVKGGLDPSKELADVFKDLFKVTLPATASAIGKVGMEAIKLGKSGATIAQIFSAIKPVLGGTLLPIGAAAAALTMVVGITRKWKERTEDVADVMDRVSQKVDAQKEAESTYKSINNELDETKTRLKEIASLQKGEISDDEAARLREEGYILKEKLTDLEQEAVMQEALMEIEKERAALAALELENKKIKSEYLTNEYGQAQEVTPLEELHARVEAFREENEIIEEKTAKLNALNQELASSNDVTKAQRTEQQALTNELFNLKEARLENKEGILLEIQAQEELLDILEETEAISDEEMYLRKLELAEDKIALLGEEAMAHENLYEVMMSVDEAAERKMERELGEEEMAYSKIENLQALQEEYYLLSQAMEELNSTGQINQDTYDGLIMYSDDYIGMMDMEQGAAYDLISASQQKMINRSNSAMNERNNTIKAVEDEIKALQDLLNALATVADLQPKVLGTKRASSKTKRINLLQTNSEVKTFFRKLTDDQKHAFIEEGAKGVKDKIDYDLKVANAELDKLRQDVRNIGTAKSNMTGGVNPFQPNAPSRGGGGGGSKKKPSRKPRSGGSKKPKKKSTAKKKKEEKLAEADAYADLNFQLARNNALLALNRSHQDRTIRGSEKHLELLEEEIFYNQQRQALLHQQNKRMRLEGRTLQKELSGIFNFEGSWEDNSIMITNMDAIEGKTKEVEEKYKRLVQIMTDLPNASNEWWKIQKALEDIEIDKMTMKFEKMHKELDKFDKAIEDKHFSIKMNKELNDFERDASLAAVELENLEKQSKIAAKQLELLNNSFKKGSIGAQEYQKQYDELVKRMRTGALSVLELEKEIDNLNKAERERIINEELERRNKILAKQREQVSAIQEVQDFVVQYIQKRGEIEREEFEKSHQMKMDQLEKQRSEREKNDNKALEDFRRRINEQIAALDEQFKEEDYQEQLRKEQEKANKLQSQIDILSLDDSLTAKNKRIALQKELAEQLENIEKMERDRSREAQKKALEDQLKDLDKHNDEKQKKRDEDYEAEKAALDKALEDFNKSWEERYSNMEIMREANQALQNGMVEDTTGALIEISQAYSEFQDEFGEGLGILGNMIKNEFIKPLEMAHQAIYNLGDLPMLDLDTPVRDDWSIDDLSDSEKDSILSDGGYKPIERPEIWNPQNRPREFVVPIYWSDEDYNEYMANKDAWANTKNAKQRAELNKRNKELREKYWGKGKREEDLYHFDELDKILKMKDGGVMDQTGLYIGHGSEQSSEVVFSAKTAKKLWDYIEHMPDLNKSLTAPRPSSAPVLNQQGNSYEIKFDVEGNFDRSLLPEVEKMISSAITKSEKQTRKEVNKIGHFRSL